MKTFLIFFLFSFGTLLKAQIPKFDTVIFVCRDSCCSLVLPKRFHPTKYVPVKYWYCKKGRPEKSISSFSITIYNKWGTLIYKSNSLTQVWDGKKDNNLVENGEYSWIINFVSKTSCCTDTKKNLNGKFILDGDLDME